MGGVRITVNNRFNHFNPESFGLWLDSWYNRNRETIDRLTDLAYLIYAIGEL